MTTSTSAFRKSAAGSPSEVFVWEAVGLSWLRVPGGAPVVDVLEVGADHLDLVRLHEVAPTPRAAEELGRGLAVVHDAGAAAYGVAPDGWEGAGFWGPLGQALVLPTGTWDTWGGFYADARIEPAVRACRDRGIYDARDTAVFVRLAQRLRTGVYDTDDLPARLHGDLWAGNVMWTPEGATLIDPAAHAGHRENDLALLALFGFPHLDVVRSAYDEAHPLAEGWRDRIGLHQLHCVLSHALLFGGGYADQALAEALRLVGGTPR